MSIFLSQILDHKQLEVARARALTPLDALIDRLNGLPKPRPFLAALKSAAPGVALVAEVKKASPSAGVIRPDFDFIKIAKEYESAGANCLSVLTDERFFQGHLSYLSQIKDSVSLPLLRKDFIVDEYQVYEARSAGADAILLIVAALDTKTLARLFELGKSLNMDVLVETHTEAEMNVASSLGADLIGINSRDLKSFVTDLSIVESLASLAPKSALLVGESGIKTASDVKRLRSAGVHAILVGETLMRANSITAAIDQLLS